METFNINFELFLHIKLGMRVFKTTQILNIFQSSYAYTEMLTRRGKRPQKRHGLHTCRRTAGSLSPAYVGEQPRKKNHNIPLVLSVWLTY